MRSGKQVEVTRAQLERAVRMYRTNKDAFEALGVCDKTFVRLCRRYSIETPAERKERMKEKWSRG